jgi:hypothetical protein
MKLAVNLLVLRCKDIEVTRRFYEQLGLAIVEEKHGKGRSSEISNFMDAEAERCDLFRQFIKEVEWDGTRIIFPELPEINWQSYTS